MKMPALILIVMVAALPMAPANPQDKANPPRKDQADESAKKIKELQKQRIATLKEMADGITNLFQRGQGSFEEVLEARMLVHKAELDAAEKESDRIALYKNMVDLLKQTEEIAATKFKAARGSANSVLKVRAMRLEAEINLERAKAKEAKAAK
jgi:outer membrane protein TolC